MKLCPGTLCGVRLWSVVLSEWNFKGWQALKTKLTCTSTKIRVSASLKLFIWQQCSAVFTSLPCCPLGSLGPFRIKRCLSCPYLLLIPPSFFLPRVGCASWLWHFLGIFIYISAVFCVHHTVALVTGQSVLFDGINTGAAALIRSNKRLIRLALWLVWMIRFMCEAIIRTNQRAE